MPMSSHDRRAAARRRAWGRGPAILRFEPLEGRQLLSSTGTGTDTGGTTTADLVATQFDTLHNLDWGDRFHAAGSIQNEGGAPSPGGIHVDVFASPTETVGPGSVLLGTINVPSGLAPGQSYSFDQLMSLPTAPPPGFDSSQTIYISLRFDPDNGDGLGDGASAPLQGQGFDTSAVTITPHQPSNLVGTSFGVNPDQATWGTPITVTAQIQNQGPGNAPATRAKIVLAPQGSIPGASDSVTIGNINVPALPAGQTANINQQITLPAGPPPSLGSATAFTIGLVPDADYQADPWYPHQAVQGPGLDQATINISAGANANVTQGPLPNLAVASVQAPTVPVAWGQNVQVSATIQNTGNAGAGPFTVQFALEDPSLNESQLYYLGSAQLNGLNAGYSQTVSQTVTLPAQLPGGQVISETDQAQIVAIVNSENTVAVSSNANGAGGSAALTIGPAGSVASATPTGTTTSTTTTPVTQPATPTGTTSTAAPTTTTTAIPTATHLATAAAPNANAPRPAANLRIHPATPRVYPRPNGILTRPTRPNPASLRLVVPEQRLRIFPSRLGSASPPSSQA